MAQYVIQYEGGATDRFSANDQVFLKYYAWVREPMQNTSWCRFNEGATNHVSIINFDKVARIEIDKHDVTEPTGGFDDLMPSD